MTQQPRRNEGGTAATSSEASSLLERIKNENLSLEEIETLIAITKSKKDDAAKKLEESLFGWKEELEAYVKKKYGVPLSRIFLSRDPSAPAKEGKNKNLAGEYKVGDKWVKYIGKGIRPAALKDKDLSTLEKRAIS